MNRQRSIAVFAAIAAIAMTTIGISGVSATPLMVTSTVSDSETGMSMLGHVEYTLRDSAGDVVQYVQGDNIVVADGKDCATRMLFGADDDAEGGCDADPTGTVAPFNYIAIGNLTAVEATTLEELPFNGNMCAETGGAAVGEGEMARKLALVDITLGATGADGTIVELTTPTAFTFKAGVNETDVEVSGLFNGIADDDLLATYDGATGEGYCVDSANNDDTNINSDYQMFSIKNLGTGITVTDGDSLAVKWTITVGGP